MRKRRADWMDWCLRGAVLFLFVGIHFWFPACGPKEDGSYMLCHWAGRGVSGCALVLLILSLMPLVLKGEAARAALAAAMLPVAVLTMVFPGGLIPLCLMPGMRCRAVMRPAVLVTGMIIFVLSLLSAVVHARRGEKK